MEVLKMIARVASIFLFIGGLVVCSGETPDWDKQIMVGCVGIGMVVGSVILYMLTEEGEEDVYTG